MKVSAYITGAKAAAFFMVSGSDRKDICSSSSSRVAVIQSRQQFIDSSAESGRVAVILFKSKACRACTAVSGKYRAWAEAADPSTTAFYEVFIDSGAEMLDLAQELDISAIPAATVHRNGMQLVPALVCPVSKLAELQHAVKEACNY